MELKDINYQWRLLRKIILISECFSLNENRSYNNYRSYKLMDKYINRE